MTKTELDKIVEHNPPNKRWKPKLSIECNLDETDCKIKIEKFKNYSDAQKLHTKIKELLGKETK